MPTERPLTWMERNEGWALSIGCLGLVLILSSVVIAVVSTSRRTLEFEAITDHALELVENDPESRRRLGENFKANMLMGGRVEDTEADILLPVRGSKAQGQVEILATRDGPDGEWHLTRITLVVEEERLPVAIE